MRTLRDNLSLTRMTLVCMFIWTCAYLTTQLQMNLFLIRKRRNWTFSRCLRERQNCRYRAHSFAYHFLTCIYKNINFYRQISALYL